jgi:hypothetical protein
MLFAAIKPKQQKVIPIEARDFAEALPQAGLKSGEIDFGAFRRDDDYLIGYAVYEYSNFVAPQEQSYAIFNGAFIAGNALVYYANPMGETISLPNIAMIQKLTSYLPAARDVEQAIADGRVRRPAIVINGKVYWAWPDLPPSDMAQAMKERRKME